MNVGIVTDSTCDLPDEIAAGLGIEVVPLYVNFGNESYLDGVELSREAFYARLPDANPPPTTAMPGPQHFLQAYERLAAAGATEIVSIHVSRSLSAVLETAQLAAKESPVPVTHFDSGSLTLGVGFLAWSAAEMATEGGRVADILVSLQDQRKRTHVVAVLDTLEYLRRSGRMNRVMATLGSWLQMKPLLLMNDGVSKAEKVRTTEAAANRLIGHLQERLPLERVALVHTHALAEAELLRQSARHLLPEGEILSVNVTPVLGTHLGPGAVGFACVSAKDGTP
jgi:DegV family protein with EDD domain